MATEPSFGGWAWGIDIAVQHLEFGFVNCDDGRFQTNGLVLPVVKNEVPSYRARRMFESVRVYAAALDQHFPCCVAIVELPTGRYPSPVLMKMAGVVEAALSEGGRPVYSDPPKAWKPACGLPGNATKEQVVAWAQGLGWQGTDEHQADGLGLAVHGAASIGACPKLTPMIAKSTARRRAASARPAPGELAQGAPAPG